MGVSQAPTVMNEVEARVRKARMTETHREAMLQKHLCEYRESIKKLKTSCEILAKTITDQTDEMDNFKRKIYALEKLLKLYL